MESKSQLKRRAIQQPADFVWLDGGSVMLLTPMSQAARDWAAEHLPADAPTLGGGIGIERRFFGDILEGITNDGMTVRES